MSKKVNEFAYEIICKTEQVKAIMRAESYMMSALVQSNMPVSTETQTLEVLENIKLTFLTDIDKLAKEIEKLSCTPFQMWGD